MAVAQSVERQCVELVIEGSNPSGHPEQSRKVLLEWLATGVEYRSMYCMGVRTVYLPLE